LSATAGWFSSVASHIKRQLALLRRAAGRRGQRMAKAGAPFSVVAATLVGDAGALAAPFQAAVPAANHAVSGTYRHLAAPAPAFSPRQIETARYTSLRAPRYAMPRSISKPSGDIIAHSSHDRAGADDAGWEPGRRKGALQARFGRRLGVGLRERLDVLVGLSSASCYAEHHGKTSIPAHAGFSRHSPGGYRQSTVPL